MAWDHINQKPNHTREPRLLRRKKPDANLEVVLDLLTILDKTYLTSKGIAELAGCHPMTFTYMRSGTIPNVNTLRNVANALGYEVVLVPLEKAHEYRIKP